MPSRDDGGFFSGGDVTADPFAEPATGEPPEDGAGYTGDDLGAEEPQRESATEEASDGGFFSAEDDPFGVPAVASIEGGSDEPREPHQKRRDAMYDKLDTVADTVAKAGAVVGVRKPEAGAIIGAVGVGIGVVGQIGRGVGAIIDDSYDRDDANLADRTKKDIDRMKNKAARDKINKTPKGFSKITED